VGIFGDRAKAIEFSYVNREMWPTKAAELEEARKI
jgi:hypothetical protein